jgi:hypothetical protein
MPSDFFMPDFDGAAFKEGARPENAILAIKSLDGIQRLIEILPFASFFVRKEKRYLLVFGVGKLPKDDAQLP